MYRHEHEAQFARGTVRPRRMGNVAAASALLSVTCSLALLATACRDSISHVTAPVREVSASTSLSVTTADFAVLANQAVTCTDGKITGSVGTDQAPPTGSVTRTSCPITGTVDVGDAAAQAAYDAFVAQYDALAPVPGECTTLNTLTGTLASTSLPGGTYCVSAEAKTGVLTLAGSGPWTFKVLGALTGTSFTVLLADPGQACNVTWWTEAAATLTDSHFIGTILAGAGITLTRGTLNGNVYSHADVTVTGTDLTGCAGIGGGHGHGDDDGHRKCNQGVGNGPEGCDPGKSNHNRPSNDEHGGTPGKPGRRP